MGLLDEYLSMMRWQADMHREIIRQRQNDMIERLAVREANEPAPTPQMIDDDHRRPTPFRVERAKGGDKDAVVTEEIITEIVDRYGDKETATAVRMLDTSVLDLLLSRSSITPDQYHAGLRISADWYHAGLANSGVVDPTREVVDGGSFTFESDFRLDAMMKYRRAMVELSPAHGRILRTVLLTGAMTLEEYGRQNHHQKSHKLARNSAIATLRDALEALDHHYCRPRKTVRGVHHLSDYRPSIQRPDPTSGDGT